MSTIEIDAEHACALIAICATVAEYRSEYAEQARQDKAYELAGLHEEAAAEARTLRDYLTGLLAAYTDRVVLEQLAIIVAEAHAIAAGGTGSVATSVATIAQAATVLKLQVGDDDSAPEITRRNGQLLDRYQETLTSLRRVNDER
nr:MAG TPA: hypothetical protein [Caudoviricetes sp.]